VTAAIVAAEFLKCNTKKFALPRRGDALAQSEVRASIQEWFWDSMPYKTAGFSPVALKPAEKIRQPVT
jgi:hypothetical protein